MDIPLTWSSELVDGLLQFFKLGVHFLLLHGLQLGNGTIGGRKLNRMGAPFEPGFEGGQLIVHIIACLLLMSLSLCSAILISIRTTQRWVIAI